MPAIEAPQSTATPQQRNTDARAEAEKLLRQVGGGTEYSIWQRLGDALTEMFTLGIAATRLSSDGAFWAQLADRLSTLPPDSPILSQVFEQMPWSLSDDLARFLVGRNGTEWVEGLGTEARKGIMRAVREGWISPADRVLYNSIYADVRAEELEAGLDALADPKQLQGLRTHYQRLLADGSGYVAKFGDNIIPMAEPARHSSWLVDLAYWNVDRIIANASEPSAVSAALAPPLVRGPDGEPVHFETVVYRPGLANKAPAAAHLFRIAQHAEHTVIAFSADDVTDASRLRPLTEYQGAPVPEALRGKIFAVGKPDHLLQSYRAGTGTLIRHLGELTEEGPGFGINADDITVFAYSQGNIETTLARLILAAHGEPDVVDRHIGLAPPMRGSLLVDNTGAELVGALASGDEGAQALADLDPDVVASFVPEFMKTTIDVAFTSDIYDGAKSDVADLSLRLLRPMAEGGIGGDTGDGVTDYRTADFAREVKVSSRALDHVAMVATSPDEFLAQIPPPDDASKDVLRLIAGASTSEPATSQ